VEFHEETRLQAVARAASGRMPRRGGGFSNIVRCWEKTSSTSSPKYYQKVLLNSITKRISADGT
jgi:hypothetical protein